MKNNNSSPKAEIRSLRTDESPNNSKRPTSTSAAPHGTTRSTASPPSGRSRVGGYRAKRALCTSASFGRSSAAGRYWPLPSTVTCS